MIACSTLRLYETDLLTCRSNYIAFYTSQFLLKEKKKKIFDSYSCLSSDRHDERQNTRLEFDKLKKLKCKLHTFRVLQSDNAIREPWDTMGR